MIKLHSLIYHNRKNPIRRWRSEHINLDFIHCPAVLQRGAGGDHYFAAGQVGGTFGTIAGGAETFFGKNKGRTIEAKLEKATSFVAVAFVILTWFYSL
jgi:hypothetical protein